MEESRWPAEHSCTHQDNKEMYCPNEIFSTESCGSGDAIQHAVNNEAQAAMSPFTIRNPTSLPGLLVPAYIEELKQRAGIRRTAKKLNTEWRVEVWILMLRRQSLPSIKCQ